MSNKPYQTDNKYTRKELLTALYNEQLDQLIRTEVDIELITYLMLKEPNNSNYAKSKSAKDGNKEQHEKILQIIDRLIKQEEKNE